MDVLIAKILEIIEKEKQISLQDLQKKMDIDQELLKYHLLSLHNLDLVVYKNDIIRKLKPGETNAKNNAFKKTVNNLINFIKTYKVIIPSFITLLSILIVITIFATSSNPFGDLARPVFAITDLMTFPYKIDKDYYFSDEHTIIVGQSEYKITKIRDIDLEGAAVLWTFNYREKPAPFSPRDYFLGWGDIIPGQSLQVIASNNRITAPRFGKENEYPFPVFSYLTQFHLIPADKRIYDAIMDIDEKDIIHIEGEWVIVNGNNGFTWGKDSGLGTDPVCEVVLVKDVKKVGTLNDKVYYNLIE